MIKPAKGGGFNVVHCHGSNKGKPINKSPMTREKAVKMHKAIQANKKRRKG